MKNLLKKIQKKHILGFVLFVLTIILMYSIKDRFSSPLVMDMNIGGENSNRIVADKGEVEQYFNVIGNISSLDILVANNGKEAEMVVGIYDGDTDELLAEKNITIPNTQDNPTGVNVDISTKDISKDGKRVCLKLSCTSKDVEYCVQKGDYEKSFYLNDVAKSYQLQMKVTYGVVYYKFFFILFFVLLIITILVWLSSENKLKSLQNMFVVVALTTGIGFAFIGPIVQECDGWEHFLRGMDVSYGNVLGSFVNISHDDGEIIVPENINEFNYKIVAPNTSDVTLFTYHLQHSYFSDKTTKMVFTGGVTSVFYWPQGLGIFVARMLGLSMYGVVVMSRIFNLLAYIGITYCAIRIMPMFRNVFTLIALFPLTIYQAASDSPDSLLNAFCFLFIALCFHYAYSENIKLTWKHTIGLGFLLICIFMCKYVYICIGILVFMIPKERFKSIKDYFISFGIAMIPIFSIGAFLTIHMGQSLNSIQATSGDVTQLQYIRSNPKIVIQAYMNTFNYYFNYYVTWLNTLGSMNYPLGILTTISPAFAIGVGCLDVNEKARKMKSFHKVLCFFAFSLSIIALFLALYIGDGRINPIGATMILGGQGRYFIAVLILIFAAFASKKVENNIEKFSTKVIGINCIMLCYAIMTMVMLYN